MKRMTTVILGCAVAILAGSGGGCAGKAEDPAIRRQRFVQQHPELTREQKALIQKGSIQNGMSAEQIRAAWGSPKTKQRPGKGGAEETWTYANGYSIDFMHAIMVRLRAPDGTVHEE